MLYKCRKCGSIIKFRIKQIIIKVRNVKSPFLCQQCMEIELWKMESRNLGLCSGKSYYGEYNVNGNCFGLTRWIEGITRDKEKLLKLYKTDGTEDTVVPFLAKSRLKANIRLEQKQ